MKSRRGWEKAAFILLIFLIPIISTAYLQCSESRNGKLNLPVFKMQTESGDSVAHIIPPFEFDGHNGEKVNSGHFKDLIYVTDFIFTNCQGTCPKMTNNLTKVQKVFQHNDKVKILSHTVDPKRDSVHVLKEYAELYEAIDGKWYFVTGAKKDLYKLGRKGYFVTTQDGDGGEHDFMHSQKLILVDKKGQIRGYYDGTDPAEVEELIEDIHLLYKQDFNEES